jgi:hypothetical protein
MTITNLIITLTYPYQYSCFLVNKVNSIIFLKINFDFFIYILYHIKCYHSHLINHRIPSKNIFILDSLTNIRNIYRNVHKENVFMKCT